MNIKELNWKKCLEKFGEPLEKEEFTLMPELPGLRDNLPEILGPQAIKEKRIIREATWPISDTHNRTIWFMEENKDWVYINHIEWNKNLEF